MILPLHTASEENVDIEDLVDDFVTFYAAGKLALLYSLVCLK